MVPGYSILTCTSLTKCAKGYRKYYNSRKIDHSPNLSSQMNTDKGIVDHRSQTEYPNPRLFSQLIGSVSQECTDTA